MTRYPKFCASGVTAAASALGADSLVEWRFKSSLAHQFCNREPVPLKAAWCQCWFSCGAVAQFGRAPVLHTGGREFETLQLHQFSNPGWCNFGNTPASGAGESRFET